VVSREKKDLREHEFIVDLELIDETLESHGCPMKRAQGKLQSVPVKDQRRSLALPQFVGKVLDAEGQLLEHRPRLGWIAFAAVVVDVGQNAVFFTEVKIRETNVGDSCHQVMPFVDNELTESACARLRGDPCC
jgi:hypothetical protein